MKHSLQEIQENEILRNKYHAELNSICSYLAMFPSEVPERYIDLYTEPGDLVYDPFSGRGTTTNAAIKLRRRVISNDLSPLAYVLTRSKTEPVSIKRALRFINELEVEFNESNHKIDYSDDKYKEIRVFYSEHNLTQLDFIREKIGKKIKDNKNISSLENYILSISLGIAHGPTRKTGDKNNSLYFSVNMPNGYSVAPGYAERFIKEKKLHKIETNIFEQIRYRIKLKRNDFIPKGNKAYLGDALKSRKYFKNEKPKLIFTSPPYLNLIKYIEQNWIRFWILGFDKVETKNKMVNDYHALQEYKLFLRDFMIEMKNIMAIDSKLIMVIGDVKENYIREIMNDIIDEWGHLIKLSIIGKPEKQPLKNKLSRQMGNRSGNATKNDWVFIFEKEK